MSRTAIDDRLALVWLLVGAGTLAFATYGSLLPFDFRPVSIDAASEYFGRILAADSRQVSRTDALANVLLFIPVGFGFAGWLLLKRRGWGRVVIVATAVLVFSVIASIAIEFLQVFTADRIPSRSDVIAQTVGTLTGFSLWLVTGEPISAWLRDLFRATPADRVSRLLFGYACAWVFVNLAPFDLTLDLGELGRRLRLGRIAIVPFSEPDAFSGRWIWDAIAEIAGAVPLGLAGRLAGTRTIRTAGYGFAIALGIILLTEGAQTFVRSHAATATDLVLAALGAAAGLVVAPRLVPPTAQRLPTGAPVNGTALLLFGVALAIACAYHWRPYDFVIDADDAKRKLQAISLVPFAGYVSGSSLGAFSNFLAKVAVALPLGVAAAFVFRDRTTHRRVQMIAWTAVALVLFTIIEAGQLFVPSRVPDVTDVAIAVAAFVAGMRVGYWMER